MTDEFDEIFEKFGITGFHVLATTWNCPECGGCYRIDDKGNYTYNTCLCSGRPLDLPRLTEEDTNFVFDKVIEDGIQKNRLDMSNEYEDALYGFFDMVKHIFGYRRKEETPLIEKEVSR